MWPKVRAEKKMSFLFANFFSESRTGYVLEPVGLAVWPHFLKSLSHFDLEFDTFDFNLSLNNSFPEAMPHGENPWTDLGCKAWTSP